MYLFPHYFLQNLEVDLTPIYTLAPAWPAVSYTAETRDDVIMKLKAYLQKRIHSREKLQTELKGKSKCELELAWLFLLIFKMEFSRIKGVAVHIFFFFF